jgi:hypothetical protein
MFGGQQTSVKYLVFGWPTEEHRLFLVFGWPTEEHWQFSFLVANLRAVAIYCLGGQQKSIS